MVARRALLVVSCLLAGCPGPDAPPPDDALLPDDPPPPLPPLPEPGGLDFVLREGVASNEPADPALPRAPATPLGEREARALLARLPPRAPAAPAPALARPASPPPPRTGALVRDPFPVDTRTPPPAPAPGPLRLLRFGPQGEVPLAADLSLTFSEPMVALTAHGELGALTPPVTLSPQPPGEWRWVGARNLVFRPRGRFPMATEFRVEVPAGIAAAAGARLADGTSFTFATPPPRLTRAAPRDATATRDPVLFLAFDQRIDPAAVLPHVELLPAGGEPLPVRLVERDEALRADEIRELVEHADEGRWLALRPLRPLPPGRDVSVILRAGLPSAEGPRVTAAPQTFAFRTFDRLAVRRAACESGWSWGERCDPGGNFRVEFNNPIDSRRLRREQVRIEPEVADLRVDAFGQELLIRAATLPRTTYTVTVDASLRDSYRQTLGAPSVHTFTVGPTPPKVRELSPVYSLVDAATPTLLLRSEGVDAFKVRLFTVTVDDWSAYLAQTSDFNPNPSATPPGALAFDGVIPVDDPDRARTTAIDLSPALKGGLGHVIVAFETVSSAGSPTLTWHWVQVTRLALRASDDATQLVALARELATGAPAAGAELHLWPEGARATTDPAGLATLPLGATGSPLLLARRGPDLAFLPSSLGPGASEAWKRRASEDALRWHVLDDRGLYRPGETARVKGWVRRRGAGPRAELRLPDAREVRYVLRDSVGVELLAGTAALGGLGAFDLALPLPESASPGSATLVLSVDEGSLGTLSHEHALRLAEFRRPEYEVSVRADPGPHVVGGAAEFTASARYFAGGSLPGAAAEWTVRATPSDFRPPGRDDFSFGPWRPWWEFRSRLGEVRRQRLAGRTDARGEHRLRAELRDVTPREPSLLEVDVAVQDVNRQSWTAATQILVHPAAVYVGLRSERSFVARGETLEIDAIAVDPQGRPLTDHPLVLVAARVERERSGGVTKEVLHDPQTCEPRSAAEPVRCTFLAPVPGAYRVTARASDDAGRLAQTELSLWVSGGGASAGDRTWEVEMIPDKKEYALGDTARILVVAPFAPAQAVLTLRRGDILEARPVALNAGATALEIPITREHEPGFVAHLDLTGPPAPASPDRHPNHTTARLEIAVPPRSRALAVSLRPERDTLEPGGETAVEVLVRDADARPVAGGEVTVAVVDEAVLALAGYQLADPLHTFFARAADYVEDRDALDHLPRPFPLELDADAWGGLVGSEIGEAYGVGGLGLTPTAAAGSPGAARTPIALRRDFDALALFAAAQPTDAAGRAQVRVRLPDNLTRYRVMAIAAAGADRFGIAESAITARLPLMVRPSPPRFLRWGDRFELPIVVQNLSDAPLSVAVAARASGIDLLQGSGRKVHVPAGDRVEVRLPAAAARPGLAHLQVAAALGRGRGDAADLEVPIWTPATAEASAAYGQLDEGAALQPIAPPAGAAPEFGGLEISTASTALAELTDALLYLVRYPHDCSEQVASRLLALAALQDVLAAFHAPGLPDADARAAAIAADVERLVRLQNDDGGWSFWGRGEPSWPFLGAHVAHALERARAAGHPVPEGSLAQALEHLRGVDRGFPPFYPAAARRPIRAYALHVRQRLGDLDRERARGLLAEVPLEEHALETLGWLLPVLGDSEESRAILRHLRGQVRETAGAAHFTTGHSEGEHLLLRSERRVDGVLLDALLGADPGSDLLPKLVRGLLSHRVAGRWQSTQENALILLALGRYFAAQEAETPDFVARAWLGARAASEARFQGRSAEQRQVTIPMTELIRAGATDLTLAKEGPGRLYYRLGLQYAPKDLSLAPLDRGFFVERRYEAVDAADDVRRDPDGTWRVRAGARVRVTIALAAQDRRYHVALVDPLPAGLEAQSPDLAGVPRAEPVAAEAGLPRLWGRWYERENLRDDRAEAFTSLLWDGVYTYSYEARATTPGAFIAPPPRAEEMYAPETFGRGASDRVIVEERPAP